MEILFCIKRKMDLKCGGLSGMDKVRAEKGEGTGNMHDSGLSTIQCNSNPPKKSNKVYQIAHVH